MTIYIDVLFLENFILNFDNTIIKGDSSVYFIKYSLCKHPLIVTISLIKSLKEIIKYLFKKSNIGLIKSEIFSFVKKIPDLDNYLDNFVLKYQKNIKEFYLENKTDNDIVISASFDFIIKRFCKYLQIDKVIATSYDIKNGCIIGSNLKGEEKVKKLKELYPNIKVINAYSDSLSDIPMLKLAKKAYLVKNEEIILYEEK